MAYRFAKGHGTENDFVLLPDADGSVHGPLSAARVRALCDRRAGLGADGVIRVIRTAALAGIDPEVADLAADLPPAAEWFMDYRNADGSVSEMCGNGVRVLARHLLDAETSEPERPIVDGDGRFAVGTRGGVRWVQVGGLADDGFTVDMGRPQLLGDTRIEVPPSEWPAVHVDMGNPHAVVFVDDPAEAGPLTTAPVHDPGVYPHGVNVEFVARRGPGHLELRVHERGVGETRSCGTGVCAAVVAAAVRDGAPRGTRYVVDVPGGRLHACWTDDDRVLLGGPAVLVASGSTDL